MGKWDGVPMGKMKQSCAVPVAGAAAFAVALGFGLYRLIGGR